MKTAKSWIAVALVAMFVMSGYTLQRVTDHGPKHLVRITSTASKAEVEQALQRGQSFWHSGRTLKAHMTLAPASLEATTDFGSCDDMSQTFNDLEAEYGPLYIDYSSFTCGTIGCAFDVYMLGGGGYLYFDVGRCLY